MENTNKKKRIYLGQIKYIHNLIQAKREELEKMKLISFSIKGNDYSKDSVQVSSTNKNKNFELIEKCIDYERVIQEATTDLINKKIEISKVIDSVRNLEYRLFLQLYYINCEPYNVISYKMSKEYNTLKSIHSLAITNIQINTKQYKKIQKNTN